ncbi:dihydrolipoyl dehydrogenase [Anaplasma capra]|uniref:dihydrolipoyl dehydrogenase n=1 Tax=Anaplasma capra TaxID=1562740 RepID=UPI0021D5C4A8|nr:dihydrolipoyl dehydrogenase [Anaplasma capra]MCU7611555.1 dihydrolipoyl dehydrogenase [Anaplasma capra]MCU7612006.1 dihydrolipoyl dehydrogenase [Anaplasma capra]
MGVCDYDVAIIGSGPGGYKCALKAAKLGLKVVCVDKNSLLGGTCLRVGCIPSKALLDYSYKYYAAKNLFKNFGVTAKDVKFDLGKMFEVRSREIGALGAGIASLFSSAGVKRLCGTASVTRIIDGGFEVSVVHEDSSSCTLSAGKVVLATGSVPASLPGIDIDEVNIMSSDGALHMDTPGKLLVIGGGAIGLEMSSVWSRLGAEVTVVEYADCIAAGFDSEVSRALLGFLKQQGINFMLSHKVVSISETKGGRLSVSCTALSSGEVSTVEVDKVLVSVGRRPNVDKAVSVDGLVLDDRGFVSVDRRYETSIKGIFAIGDVIGGVMLAHKAEMEGCAVARLISGDGASNVDYGVIPAVIYTHPAVSSVGRSEDYVKSVGHNYRVGKSSFAANGRARITGESEGFVKVVSCGNTGTILGVHIIGAHADTMINEAVVALGYRASSEDICHICHSHPDVNEVFRDACEVACCRKS